MQNQGYSTKNLHQGDVRITKDLQVDGKINVDELKVNQLSIDGYTLPTTPGTDGQVLTMNPDGKTTDFKDIIGGVSRVWTNLYSMTENQVAFSDGYSNIDSKGVGTKTIDNSDFAINSVLKFTASGQYNLEQKNVSDSLKVLVKLRIDDPLLGAINVELWDLLVTQNPPGTSPSLIIGAGYYDLSFYVIRIDSTTLRIGSVCANATPINDTSTNKTITTIKNSLRNPSINLPIDINISNSGTLTFNVKQRMEQLWPSGSRITLNTYIYNIDYCSANQSVLATSQTLTSNHLSLSNLNANGPSGYADAGHSLMYLSDGSKPMTGDLNMNENSINNLGNLQGNGNIEVTASQFVVNPTTSFNSSIFMNGNNIESAIRIDSNIPGSGLQLVSNSGNVELKCSSFLDPEIPILSASYTNVEAYKNFICPSINNLTPVGGVSASIVDGQTITATNAELSLLPSIFVGSRSVPPNTFKVGDSYSAILSGDFGSSNGDNVIIRLKAGPTASLPISFIQVPLVNSSNTYYELEIDFCIRATGALGEIAINYDFSYNQSGSGGAWQGERKSERFIFDTSVLNTLDITAQFSSNNSNNLIRTLFSTLSKIY